MKRTLERTLTALSVKEKAEVIDLLLPEVVRDDAEPIAPELLAELEQRAHEYERNPVGFTVEEVEAKLFKR